MSSAVVVIAMFLPWQVFTLEDFSASVNGLNVHSYLALALVVDLLLFLYLLTRAGWDQLPIRLPVAHAPALLVLGVMQLLTVLVAFFQIGAGWTHGIGSWLGLIGALGASLPIVIPAVQSLRSRSRV